ncbi:MAG TPA: glycoside hydrolase family 2 TIM barrel-domain containing protein [Prolixibacteraceae bacterium]|nr:glycoside hydrolase family 2 TIM barrel-domain containing protein [Prolixibacteraceae bacterium]
MKKTIVFISLTLWLFACQKQASHRKEISLNGLWQMARTDSIASIPSSFESQVPVPGLVDMAQPAVDNQDTAYQKSVYWYKKTFTLDEPHPGMIQLKINKARYHTRVYLNGKLVGENTYNFTPSFFNVKPFLKESGEENELVIAVGCKNNLPDSVTHGGDFEKIKYIPGIYDDVKLIVTGYPFIANIQTVPDIKNRQLRVVAEIQKGEGGQDSKINFVIRESQSKRVITQGSFEKDGDTQASSDKIDFTVKMDSCHLWTPDHPFLYDLELSTSGDNTRTRFGMRTFEAAKDSGVFLLNGEPYYLHGTNVCIYRFFEDPNRKGLPWDAKWTAKLHDQFKDMHWNSIRYCIGFPPERWYEIADSIGLLIQDEFPIWTGGKGGFEESLKGITSRQLATEYTHWMRERWNHPCVVIWDAQNESVNDTTGKAIQLVRPLDLSNHPWDNGWAPPMSETDAIESHPYLFVQYFEGKNPSAAGAYKDLLSEVHLPMNDPNQYNPKPNGERYRNPVIINEYSWLWLNRDGSTTTLTDRVYKVAFPEATTTEQRFETYAKATAILTEYWRAYRQSAGVMHFCGLGYSRSGQPRGQTSDNFIDLDNLVFEPQFYKYVKASFSPVGMMVELWDKAFKGGAEIAVPVHVFNDTGTQWKGKMKLNVSGDNDTLPSREVDVGLDKYEKKIISFQLTLPKVKGNYHLQSEINYKDETVISNRDFRIE